MEVLKGFNKTYTRDMAIILAQLQQNAQILQILIQKYNSSPVQTEPMTKMLDLGVNFPMEKRVHLYCEKGSTECYKDHLVEKLKGIGGNIYRDPRS